MDEKEEVGEGKSEKCDGKKERVKERCLRSVWS